MARISRTPRGYMTCKSGRHLVIKIETRLLSSRVIVNRSVCCRNATVPWTPLLPETALGSSLSLRPLRKAPGLLLI